jgi:eukaryotic-like serine/threonine-protein kinase
MQEITETTPASTPAAPRTDRLELVKELPRGSVGVVHKARSPQLDRVSALRQFQVPEWLDDATELMKKILSESRAASGLEHANIGRLYTCGYKDFNVFMTAEFVEGQTLKEMLAGRTPDMNEVLRIAKQLCAAVDYAHSKGVFHHFLNPYNIKLQADGTLKLLDFGILRDKNILTPTPAKKLDDAPYCSPEQVKNRPIDAATNIFNIGVILYELYTTRSPFAGKHLGEVDRSITDAMPHPLNVANSRVPEQISRVVMKAIAKNPAERYRSGEQLIAALESAMREPAVISAAARPATGKFPAMRDGNATGSFNRSQFNAAVTGPQTSSFRPAPSPSTTQRVSTQTVAPQNLGSQTLAPQTLAPQTFASKTTARKASVGNSKTNWALAGIVIAGLFMLGALAMMFHKPAETQQEVSDAAPAKKPVKVVAPAAATPDQEAAAPAAESEPAASESRVTRSQASRQKAHQIAQQFTQTAAAASTGELTVGAAPIGSIIEIEGQQGQWKSPATIGSLPAGNYKVTVTHIGYAPETRVVQIAGGSRTPLDLKLTPNKGFINVAGSPAGAGIIIDGKETGKTTPSEIMLDPGQHNVVLRKNGYLEASTDIKLSAGQAVSYSPSLMVAGRTDNIKIVAGGLSNKFGGNNAARNTARIEIKSEPRGAQVIVNGTPLQKLTPVEIQVDAGSYDITLQKDGYKPQHETAIVGLEDRIKVEKTLSR